MTDRVAAKPIKILMLEDSADDVTIIERVLRKSKLQFVKQQVDRREEYRDAILNFKPDVVLSDHALPGFNSREALRICRKELGDTPFILVSGTASDEFAAACIREGADDYISKSDLTNLALSIRSALKKRKVEKLKRESVNAIRKAFRQLQQVNEELDRYAYTVSHTLRGPLTTVKGLLNLAEQTHDLASLRSLHAMIQTSVNRLDSTLIRLLEQARNANTDIKSERIEWVNLIDEVLRGIAHLDPDKSVNTFMHLETAADFYSDAERIAAVLTHVIGNTFVHRSTAQRHEGITGIEVFTTAEAAVIVVKDNGKGIPAELLPKVFDMFFKGDSSSAGSGLGLFLAKHTVTKLGGTIEITSHQSTGTTVRIELPNRLAV